MSPVFKGGNVATSADVMRSQMAKQPSRKNPPKKHMAKTRSKRFGHGAFVSISTVFIDRVSIIRFDFLDGQIGGDRFVVDHFDHAVFGHGEARGKKGVAVKNHRAGFQCTFG